MKKSISIEEHREGGLKLAAIRDTLICLDVIYSNKYPHKKTRPLEAAIKAIDRFRSDMDDVACMEHYAVLGDTFMRLYYPDQEQRKSVVIKRIEV